MALGIDIVEISRFKDKEHLVPRLLSPSEQKLYCERANKLEFLAGRFAAKEAFLKALKKGLGAIPLTAISILNNEDGAPVLYYQNQQYEVSIAHDGAYAVAVVHLESKDR